MGVYISCITARPSETWTHIQQQHECRGVGWAGSWWHVSVRVG
jgi:hypothetical protein